MIKELKNAESHKDKREDAQTQTGIVIFSLPKAVDIDRRPESKGSQNAQKNYDRYLALAQAEVRAGNVIGAENYYQHAEHYFRTMSAERGAV